MSGNEMILAAGGIVGALGVIWAAVYGIVKWIQKREGDSKELKDFRAEYDKERAELKESVRREITEVKEDFRREVAELRGLHEKDIKEGEEREKKALEAVQKELCVLSYAMLASLDGLKQLHCNGEVTKAHEKLEKHLNLKAHDQ